MHYTHTHTHIHTHTHTHTHSLERSRRTWSAYMQHGLQLHLISSPFLRRCLVWTNRGSTGIAQFVHSSLTVTSQFVRNLILRSSSHSISLYSYPSPPLPFSLISLIYFSRAKQRALLKLEKREPPHQRQPSPRASALAEE